jgi:hypothetical protein
MAKLKNQWSGVSVDRILEVIRKCLVDHKAKQIIFDYGDDGRIKAIIFTLDISSKPYGFKLPSRFENVSRILYGKQFSHLTDSQREQSYRTAWANIRDWITVQMALIDTEMVKPEEVFLPYMITREGKTYFETLEEKQFLLEG